ncbi:MAG: hypothetical protein K8S97_13180, partial [Anaerolineae bacterium]|nr:hypothetical protein [Anaerolineae bacterium]
MRIKHLLALMLIVVLAAGAVVPATLPATYAQGGCGDAPPPRLRPGGRGIVLFTDGSPLNVRESPSINANLNANMAEGTEFTVDSGPVCADNINWWAVTAGSAGGWIAEGVAGEYFVGPLDPIGALPDASLSVVPFPPTIPFAPPDWTSFRTTNWDGQVNPFLITVPPVYAGDMPSLPVDL